MKAVRTLQSQASKKEFTRILISAIVRRWKNCDQFHISEVLVAWLNHFMSATNQFEFVFGQEVFYDLKGKWGEILRIMTFTAYFGCVTFAPKVTLQPPRSFSPHSDVSSVGSAHNKSHIKPSSGTGVGRWMSRIWFMVSSSGLKPPLQQNIFFPTVSENERNWWKYV